jgi:hypothetical protein
MLPATLPQFDPKRLYSRLARLRRRLRVVTALRGTLTLVAVIVGGAAIVGLLDWRFQLPALVRAIALVSIVSAAGYVLIRRLLTPLAVPADNLHLALQLEDRNPELNDALASAVQFLEQPAEDEEQSSPLLRRVAIRHAIRLSEKCNFTELISLRGLFLAILAAGAALAVALPPVLRNPAAAQTAMRRLVAPFGVGQWPAQTHIRVTSPDQFPYRHALGDGLEIRAEVSGFVPERATLSVWFDGAPPVDSTWIVDERGLLIARLEASRIQRSFRFRVKANDGVTPWHDVQVLPPPELVPLDGRPSPQIRLAFPRYTDLLPRPLPDGGTTFEAVAGTIVHLRAAVSRPVARAWIAYKPEYPILTTSSALLALGTASQMEFVTSFAAGESVWKRVPVTLSREGTVLDVTFTPRIPGVYGLRFEDETGFGATRLIDARVLADPAPAVSLDRPSATHDSLNVTPKAVLPLKSVAADPMFAVRNAWLEYRTAKEGAIQSRPHYLHDVIGPTAGAVTGQPLRLRAQNVVVNDKLRLETLRHPDGSSLKEGDVVIIQMLADDFDDVTGDKQPGRSHEVELKIVSPATLESMLQQEQANIRANLLRLKQWQQEARERVETAKTQKENTGKLRPEDQERLLQAEQLQQQIRGRIGDEKEGLRAEVDRVREALKDNQLPPSAAQNRMDSVANELDRLAREELEQVEPLLNSAREMPESGESKKPDGAKPDPMKIGEKSKEPLADALKHQQEVEQTLEQLLQRLEPWSGANEIRGETRALLNEQEKIGQETQQLDDRLQKKLRDELTEQDKADLENAAKRQEALANQLKQTIDKMNRLGNDEKPAQERERLKLAEELEKKAEERERLAEQQKGTEREKELRAEAEKLRKQAQDQKDAAANLKKEAQALKDAADMARNELMKNAGTGDEKSSMQKAADEMKNNRLGNAKQEQRETAKSLQKMLDRLEEKRTDDLDRLSKKMRETEAKLDDLVDKQERLQKKVKQAQQIPNAEERKVELERLAREQEKLRDEAKDLLQELSRLKADAAAQSLSRAERSMSDAQQRMERGEKSDDAEEDALNKLDRAQDQLEQQRQQVEEELAREKLEKVLDRIKGIRDRQETMNKEMVRIHRAALKAQKAVWDKPLAQSLADQVENERGLADELGRMVENEFKPIKVAAKMLDHSSEAMRLAAVRAEARLKDINGRLDDEPFDEKLEAKLHADVVKWQETALRRIDQLLEALKPDKDDKKLGGEKQQPSEGGGPMGGGGIRGGDEGVPLLAQLKALRSLQAEVNERTAQFAKDHPDLNNLTEDEKAELTVLRKMQADVAQLLQDYQVGDDPKEGGRP